jgi:hypothetical protein
MATICGAKVYHVIQRRFPPQGEQSPQFERAAPSTWRDAIVEAGRCRFVPSDRCSPIHRAFGHGGGRAMVGIQLKAKRSHREANLDRW